MLPAQIDRPPSRSAVASSAANHLAKAQGQIGKLLTYAPTDGLVPIELAAASPMSRLRSVARTGNLLIGFFVVGLGTWSALAPLTSAAVASGVVEPESSRKTIQHLEGGIIRQIRIKNGDTVTSGQILIDLDDTKFRSERDSLKGQLWDAEARHARLLAEQDDADSITYPPEMLAAMVDNPAINAIVTGQQRIFETRRQVMRAEIAITEEKMKQVQQEVAGLTAQKAALSERVEISRQELESVTTLTKKGLEKKSRVLNLQREKADISGRVGESAAQISRAYQVISEAQAYLVKLRSDRLNEVAQTMRETETQILQLSERLRAIDDQLARTAIRAPEDGVIMDLRVHTTGGVIGAGEPLVDLVPRKGRLIVTARVRPEDINLVHPGLTAQVHLLPYNQRRVPLLKGQVEYVSADRLVDKQTGQSYYAATIHVVDERLATMSEVELVAGMPAQTLIETGTNSVALYALRPLLDSFNRAFRED
ncbi:MULTISPECIES: HlyD family type I secretion periplasmic adaptor subunit [Ensifer]|jgi:HlyD family secretion protein|uniref:Membrane fusion protein (MFP) family protein n=1 Tax=Ensifer canadensis TaxID=555315 RepID=A0AAW4FKB6_9HYPH|nr:MULTISPECIES: HlyD family type I secretion periplasmic adaptor subunit [Ensifer]AHK45291.1 alkaline protease secretion protein AprE [Ensifer adhaerens OV14]MDP9633459.1 HlyD family secretion protein [Ensifer adhaerens]KQU91990.1 hemolysin secretion protein D [Ensifer sp. Root31]KQW60275.1 hemolysin secretion protein D [Ensifer sp. Root1252]KQW70287.1 hemolysin secretion protein D [Ensifer sp. Root127]